MKNIVGWLCLAALTALGCRNAPPAPSAEPPAVARPTAPPAAEPAGHPAPAVPAALDPAVVEASTGGKAEVTEGVVKVSFPRNDVKVEVDGWAMPPFMGLTSWAGFTPGQKAGIEAMVMGDLVLFEDEVSDAMSAALDAGLEVTALHNHFFYDRPKVYFMHIGGEGKLDALGKGVRAALDATRAIRQKMQKPRERLDGQPIPAKSAIDPAKVEAALGVKGTVKDGMVKAVIGRPAAVADCGCKIGKAMGVNTWAAFAGTDDNAVVDGDFAVTEDELQPVLKALRAGKIHIVAIHQHMVGEEPRILFFHYWGRGPVAELGKVLKGALGLTKSQP
ncbi:DUF1259 domain-containing protein [Sorangium sp. So ce363]|uniref:DUF1259 domain-containing protein n=1 Tax=Sorangium sp. So ce363 TaxID=3133304 RepID=UPI003F5E5E67